MSMISLFFLFFFLPLALTIYYLSNDSAKEYVLLAISLLFYSFGSKQFIILFMMIIAITVLFGRMINYFDNRIVKTGLLISGITINTGLLTYYKYSNLVLRMWERITSSAVRLNDIALPLGISFFTFKSISYLVDVYKSRVTLTDNPIHDALYLSFFPQIQSGPLSRYSDMNCESCFKAHLFNEGVFRFLVGFNKKVLLANVLSNITTEVFATPFEKSSTLFAWLGAICYSLQLFFDFSGYSDMAIGVSEMFGYQCVENFNYPYMTESVTKFWRRWHISLSLWFRDYIYIPLGGSRNKKKWKVYFNLLVVWILTGLWHGAAGQFIVWGIGYFTVIAFERLTHLPERLRSKWLKTVYRFLSLLFIIFQWVLFNSQNLDSGWKYIKKMVIYTPNRLADLRTAFLLKDYLLFIIVGILLCFPIVPWIEKKTQNNKTACIVFNIALTLIVMASFVWSLSFVVAGRNNPFAYANF